MKWKRTFTGLLALMLILTACGASSAAEKESQRLSQLAAVAFSDVAADASYGEAVAWCLENGLMNGVSDTQFDPDGTLTRAMVATILYRADGEPAVSETSGFADTEANVWYSDAVTWANGKGLLLGYGNGLFGTTDPVSVEQLEVVLGRYVGNGIEWIGDPERAQPATRAQAAESFYATLKGKIAVPASTHQPSGGSLGSSITGPAPSSTSTPTPALTTEGTTMNTIIMTFNGHTYTATLEDNSSAEAFAALLENGPLTISASDYGNFEKVGPLGTSLPRNDTRITTAPGDIILYQGNQITVYYDENTWSFTRLGRVDDPSGLRDALGSGDVEITFALPDAEMP